NDAEAAAFAKCDDPISFFIETGRREVALRIALNKVSLALYSDLLHFIYEALRAFEKRKFTIEFSLLRKPLKQSLMFATWMCADEEEFFTQLERSPADNMEEKDLPPARRINLLKRAIERIVNPSFFDAELIHNIIFEKDLETGLAPLFDKATH